VQLFKGDARAYDAHLRAVVQVFQRYYAEHVKYLGFASTTSKAVVDESTLIEHAILREEHQDSLLFLAGVVTWFDISYAVTEGSIPYIVQQPMPTIVSNSSVAIHAITGSEDWALILVSRIAGLHGQRTEKMQQNSYVDAEFWRDVAALEKELDFALSPRHKVRPGEETTRILILATSIYLHLVAYGFSNLERVHPRLAQIMAMLEETTLTKLFAHMLSIFISACIARPEDESVFRGILQAITSPPAIIKHRCYFLSTIEEVWRRRLKNTDLRWADVIDLTSHILLL
jgi:hypothetical protein